MPLSPLLSRYDQVICDLDGCVWVGDTVVAGAVEALAALRAAGKRIAFLTNDARRSPEEYVRKLWGLGIQTSVAEVVTVGGAIQHVLAERAPQRGALVIGAPAIFRHVEDSGARILNGTPRAEQADVVVVASHDAFGIAELTTALRAVHAGARMLAAGRDRSFPGAGGLEPGTGALVAALEYATGQTAVSVGKPDPQIFATALDRLGPGRTLVIGDRLDVDLAGAAAAGLDGAIVLSGVARRAEAEAATDPAPVAVARDLHELLVA